VYIDTLEYTFLLFFLFLPPYYSFLATYVRPAVSDLMCTGSPGQLAVQ
jgi:hypothetical protein